MEGGLDRQAALKSRNKCTQRMFCHRKIVKESTMHISIPMYLCININHGTYDIPAFLTRQANAASIPLPSCSTVRSCKSTTNETQVGLRPRQYTNARMHAQTNSRQTDMDGQIDKHVVIQTKCAMLARSTHAHTHKPHLSLTI